MQKIYLNLCILALLMQNLYRKTLKFDKFKNNRCILGTLRYS